MRTPSNYRFPPSRWRPDWSKPGVNKENPLHGRTLAVAGDLSVDVDIGAIPSGSRVTVEFDAMVGALPPGVETVSNQGSVSATDVAVTVAE